MPNEPSKKALGILFYRYKCVKGKMYLFQKASKTATVLL